MRYSVERKDRIYGKGYRFFSFAKSMGTQLNSKYGQNQNSTTEEKLVQKEQSKKQQKQLVI